MTVNDSWRQSAREAYRKDDFPFDLLAADDLLVYWVCVGTLRKYKENTYGAYVEVHLNQQRNEMFAVGFTYFVWDCYRSLTPLQRVAVSTETDAPILLTLTEKTMIHLSFDLALASHIDAPTNTWRLDSVTAGLTSRRYKVRPLPQMAWAPWTNQAHSSIARVSVPCPECWGKGGSLGFAIPKEAYAGGLSGYALYSENRVNCEEACTTCGGTGTMYRPWYAEEEPEITSRAPRFKRGRGAIEVDAPSSSIYLPDRSVK